MLELNFHSISEATPGNKWQNLFNRHWFAYKSWFESKGAVYQPPLAIAFQQLEKHMPEMVPLYKKLCALAGDDEIAARFLTGYKPPAYITGCSQAIWQHKPLLVRNYDYHPNLSEGTLLHSAWHGRQVIATGDCLYGVVDGMNDDGLAVSLTFGGRKAVGNGFGIPFILRYILEFCGNTAEAVEVLKRVPSHMSYNVAVIDKTGSFKTVQVAPDRSAVITDFAVSTNHQGEIDWPEHALFSKTVEREKFLKQLLAEKSQKGEQISKAFLQSPLFNQQYNDGFGTIYTAVYHPAEGSMQLQWPGKTLTQAFDNFIEGVTNVKYTETGVVPVPTYAQPAYEIPAYQENADANYWIEYGKAWSSGQPATLSQLVGKTLLSAMGIDENDIRGNILADFTGEAKRRGQVPWEMLADLWSAIGKDK